MVHDAPTISNFKSEFGFSSLVRLAITQKPEKRSHGAKLYDGRTAQRRIAFWKSLPLYDLNIQKRGDYTTF